MKMSLSLILLMSLPAMAQRINECPNPGQVLSSNYLGETSDSALSTHRRSGTASIPTTAVFSGSVRARIFKNYRDTVCKLENYQHTDRVCNRISPDLALGRGNEVLASLYDLHITTLKRADIFSRNVKFQVNSHSSIRLESARQVVEALAKAAVLRGAPKSWEDFSSVLQSSVSEGSLQQFLVDEILMVNQLQNKRALGLIPLEGASIEEGVGNGRLNQVFDLGITLEHRASRINKLLTGISLVTARSLSRAFVDFASVNGIPSNWNQFVLMMKTAKDTNVISEKEFLQVTVDYEDVNRDALGYQISAQLCRLVTDTRQVNVVRVQNRQNLDREVSQNYKVEITDAPLVTGEQEVINVRYDGFKAPTIDTTVAYNTYTLSQNNDGNSITFKLIGTRKLVRPSNTLKVNLSRSGTVSKITLQNTAFNAKVSGKVIVKASYFNGRFLAKDRLLATETYELKDGNLKTITANIRNKDVDYVMVSMQIVGSPYYSSEFSTEVKAKD